MFLSILPFLSQYVISDLGAAKEQVSDLTLQISALRGAVDRNQESVGIMKVKDDRLVYLEAEVKRLREEVLTLANIRGDNEQLKDWLEAERKAHAKQMKVSLNSVETLNKKLYSSQVTASRLKNSVDDHAVAVETSTLELIAAEGGWREKEVAAVTQMVKSLLVEYADRVVLACEKATVVTAYRVLGRRRSPPPSQTPSPQAQSTLTQKNLTTNPSDLFVGPALVVADTTVTATTTTTVAMTTSKGDSLTDSTSSSSWSLCGASSSRKDQLKRQEESERRDRERKKREAAEEQKLKADFQDLVNSKHPLVRSCRCRCCCCLLACSLVRS
jgi:hypothetical protein